VEEVVEWMTVRGSLFIVALIKENCCGDMLGHS
jgi:hypothetical protein